VTYDFDLVPEQGELRFVDRGFERASYLLREFQPATRVQLIGSPPSRIRVRAQGKPAEVAPGILAQVEALGGASLRYELVD
jgi:hypothetical protein